MVFCNLATWQQALIVMFIILLVGGIWLHLGLTAENKKKTTEGWYEDKY